MYIDLKRDSTVFDKAYCHLRLYRIAASIYDNEIAFILDMCKAVHYLILYLAIQ